MRHWLILLALISTLSPAQKQFSKIRVGMKDAQVEKIVGLPVEIFRGFPKIVIHSVEVVGQANYTCWRYRFSKEIRVDSTSESVELSDSIGFRVDTTYFIDGRQRTKRVFDMVTDTLFYMFSEDADRIPIESDLYHRVIRTNRPSNYGYELVASRERRMDTTTLYRTSTFCVPVEYVGVYSQCILFDPFSNRVVDVGYYPTMVDKRIVHLADER